eukprot:scaffold85555_cov31-Tisochrysis_lutea.AAC.1
MKIRDKKVRKKTPPPPGQPAAERPPTTALLKKDIYAKDIEHQSPVSSTSSSGNYDIDVAANARYAIGHDGMRLFTPSTKALAASVGCTLNLVAGTHPMPMLRLHMRD